MIHCYKLNGYNIVIDSGSASVHVVDEVAYEAILAYENGKRDDVAEMLTKRFALSNEEAQELLDEVDGLKADGVLYAPDMTGTVDVSKLKSRGEIKALCLHVAHTCNLSCEYCFAGQGRYQGKSALMSEEVGKRALDFLIEHSGSRHNLEVDFFGGEPLMNFDVVKSLTAYARKREKECGKHFRFTLTTNGVLLDDEVTRFCNEEMDNVVLSLDGRRDVHDRFRIYPSGKGSYDDIVPRFKRFVEQRGDKSYYIRGTYTHANPDFASDIIHMAELGFDQLSMEPVVCPEGEKYALTEEDLPTLYAEYERLALYMLDRAKAGKPVTFYHYMIDLEHGPCIYKRLSGCGSGTEYLAVTPTGELYPCHQFVSHPEFCLGNVYDGITKPEEVERFGKCSVPARPECADCWAKLWCAGGCAANAYHATGDILGTYEYGCKLFKKRIECAIMMKAALDSCEE